MSEPCWASESSVQHEEAFDEACAAGCQHRDSPRGRHCLKSVFFFFLVSPQELNFSDCGIKGEWRQSQG